MLGGTDDGGAVILGGVVGIQDDGTHFQAFYFTSEQEAREGE